MLMIRDPTTGWGSIDYPSFSAIFEVATPYTAPSSGSGSNALVTVGGVSLSTTYVEIIAAIVVFVVSIVSWLCCCCCSRRKAIPVQAKASAVHPTHATDARYVPAARH